MTKKTKKNGYGGGDPTEEEEAAGRKAAMQLGLSSYGTHGGTVAGLHERCSNDEDGWLCGAFGRDGERQRRERKTVAKVASNSDCWRGSSGTYAWSQLRCVDKLEEVRAWVPASARTVELDDDGGL